MRWLLALSLVWACGDDATAVDAGFDAGADAALEAGTDAALVDAGRDVGVDSGPSCETPGECDLLIATSCGDGMRCDLADGTTSCSGAGEGAQDAACMSSAQCQAGFICASGACRALCAMGSVGQCPSENICIGVLSGGCAQFCLPKDPPCDIYAQDCPDGQGCTLSIDQETNELYTGCRMAGLAGLGEPCGTGVGECQRGFICINRDEMRTCHEVCEMDNPMCSDMNQTCTGESSSWDVTYCRSE